MSTGGRRLTTIRLYGKMASMFGRIHRVALETNTTAEAMSYLRSQFPAITPYLMKAKDNGIGFAVFHGKENVTEDQLHDPVGAAEIRIAPIIMGSKNGGVFNIILGAVLVVVGAWISGMSFGLAAPIGGAMMTAGWGMIIGGVVQLLTPVPHGTKNKSVDNEPSYSFNGAVNTQAQGNPVPLLYGRMIVGSAVISAGINAEDYSPKNTGIGGGVIPPGGGVWNPKTPYEELEA